MGGVDSAHRPTASPPGSDAFHVHLEVFEGPLDLLLKLIERRQLDISKVALAEVADSFLAYLKAHPHMPPGPLASFVWVASKLLWIKSQALLPKPPTSHADEEEEDPGEELVQRLEAYKRVQDAAKWLRERERQGLRSYERPALLPGTAETIASVNGTTPMSTGLDGVTLARLVHMVQKRMQLRLPVERPSAIIIQGHTVTLAHMVERLRERLNRLAEGERVPLGQDFSDAAVRSRAELVVLFLAVLEVVRRRLGEAEQDELFGEIWLKRVSVSTNAQQGTGALAVDEG